MLVAGSGAWKNEQPHTDEAAAAWAAAEPVAIGLAIGLIAGPIISGFAGVQVRTSTAQAAVRASVVEQQATFCAERARAASTGTAQLDWRGRSDLAREWPAGRHGRAVALAPGAARGAAMPGSAIADTDVVYACTGKLQT